MGVLLLCLGEGILARIAMPLVVLHVIRFLLFGQWDTQWHADAEPVRLITTLRSVLLEIFSRKLSRCCVA